MAKILSPSLKRKGSSSINEEAIQAPFRIWSKNYFDYFKRTSVRVQTFLMQTIMLKVNRNISYLN